MQCKWLEINIRTKVADEIIPCRTYFCDAVSSRGFARRSSYLWTEWIILSPHHRNNGRTCIFCLSFDSFTTMGFNIVVVFGPNFHLVRLVHLFNMSPIIVDCVTMWFLWMALLLLRSVCRPLWPPSYIKSSGHFPFSVTLTILCCWAVERVDGGSHESSDCLLRVIFPWTIYSTAVPWAPSSQAHV